MAKTIFSADDARKMVENLSAARMERIENSIVGQIEVACEGGESVTIWRSPLPDEMRKKLEENGYKVWQDSEEKQACTISWG